jgi:hypothetical protein
MIKLCLLGRSLAGGVVVELGLRFTPGARENLGSNPSDPTTANSGVFFANQDEICFIVA